MAICVVFVALFQPFTRQQGEKNSNESIQSVLASIEGVGAVKIYIHQDNEDTTNRFFSNYFETQETSVSTTGILVVAEGAKSDRVRRMLTETIADVFNIPAHRIVIVPMKEEE